MHQLTPHPLSILPNSVGLPFHIPFPQKFSASSRGNERGEGGRGRNCQEVEKLEGKEDTISLLFLFSLYFTNPITTTATLTGTSGTTAKCDDAPPTYPWDHLGLLSSYDGAALRRGFQVYRQVCTTCHSNKRIHYCKRLGNTHTTTELIVGVTLPNLTDPLHSSTELRRSCCV